MCGKQCQPSKAVRLFTEKVGLQLLSVVVPV